MKRPAIWTRLRLAGRLSQHPPGQRDQFGTPLLIPLLAVMALRLAAMVAYPRGRTITAC